tara:strand:+ start:413 stop:1102 length:690 start_codon:yes stop_codon:yes gene_type:complete
MAKEYKIEINKRDAIGKKEVKKLRSEGNIPGVFYSRESNESIPFQVDKKHFNEALKSGANLFNISVGKNKQVVIFKAAQYHPVTDEILHLDFYGIKMDEVITVKVPINFIGQAPGVKDEGGVLNTALTVLDISCLPLEIPDFFEVDISKLNIGDTIRVSDLEIDGKYKFETSENVLIVSVTQPMKEEEVTTDEEDGEFLDGDASEASDGEEAKNTDSDGPDASKSEGNS